MDERTLSSLEEAFRPSPENEQLLAVLLNAYLDGEEPEKGLSLLRGRKAASFGDPRNATLAARLFLAAGDAERALEFARDQGPEALIVRARALLMLGRREEGRRCFEPPPAANPTVEDPKLAAAFASK